MNNFKLLKSYNLILIRYSGEIWLKSKKVKMRMIKVLVNNIRNMLEREEIPYTKYQITNDSARILFFFKNKYLSQAIELISKVFGVYSLSPAFRTSNRIENISERAIEIGEKIFVRGDSFALRIKRSGKHDFSSKDVANEVGESILDHFSNLDLTVDLSNPEKKIFIEVRNEFSYLFTDIIETPWEGLPIEYKKKVGVMDIGRQSDLLAGFLLMRRGCEIYPILFDITDGKDTIEERISNWRVIFNYTPFSKFTIRIMEISPILDYIKNKLDKKEYFCALCRLIRFQISEYISESFKGGIQEIRGLTDGLNFNDLDYCKDRVDLESISLSHLFTDQPILAPLVGFNGELIRERIRDISLKISKIDYCKYKPKNQEIKTGELKKIYKTLNIKDFFQKILNNSKEVVLSKK